MIRKATIADAPRAFEIRNEAILSQCVGLYSLESMQRWTSGDMPDDFAHAFAKDGYVFEQDGQVLAVGMLSIALKQLDAMFVASQAMGQGIGRQIVQHLEQLAREQQLTQLRLDATLNAAAFYRRCGFVGSEQSVYHSPRGFDLACIPMVKILDS